MATSSLELAMRIKHHLLVLFLLCTSALGNLSWNKVPVSGTYPGRGETALSLCDGNKICLLGGRGTNHVHVLDTQTLQWTAGQPNSLEMHHFQAFQGPDDCVWVAGAWTGPFPAEETVNNIWRYCPQSDEWIKGVDIERPRGAGGAFFYKGKVYLVTGNFGGHRQGAVLVPWFDSYDPATGEWQQLPDMPNPRDHCNAVVLDDKVYVTGGRRSISDFPEFFDDTVAEVDVYDFATGEWSTLTQLSRPRGGTAAAVLGGAVYVMGGEGDNRAWTETDVLKGSSFRAGPSLPEPRHGTGIVSCSGAIWIAGGERVIGAGNPATDTYALYDGDQLPVCRGSAPSASSAAPTAQEPDEASPIASASPSGTESHESKESTAPNDTSSAAVGADEVEASNTPSNAPSPSAEDPASTESSAEDAVSDSGEPASARACFPSDATVQLEDGSIKAMGLLRIGDRVKVAHPSVYSEVYFFSHNHPDKNSEFVHIRTSEDGVSLTLSAGHLVYIDGALLEASRVRVGDKVSISHKSSAATVTGVSRITAKGLHNPHTVHGDIVVNGVIASTYTSALPRAVAKVLLAPLKVAYRTLRRREHMELVNRVVLRTLDAAYWRD